MVAARDELFQGGDHDSGATATQGVVGWADALIAMADRSLGAASRPHRGHLVLLHVGTEPHADVGGHLHLGPGLSDGLRRFLSCDVRVRPVLEAGGLPASVGRAFRTVPDRTRMVIEERDRGCPVPGCERTRWLHVHHVQHWEDGGTSDTPNLIALCHRHHRLHHLGRLGISRNADDPDGMAFTDERGRQWPIVGDRYHPANHSSTPPGGSTSRWAVGHTRPASGPTSTSSTSADPPADQPRLLGWFSMGTGSMSSAGRKPSTWP